MGRRLWIWRVPVAHRIPDLVEKSTILVFIHAYTLQVVIVATRQDASVLACKSDGLSRILPPDGLTKSTTGVCYSAGNVTESYSSVQVDWPARAVEKQCSPSSNASRGISIIFVNHNTDSAI